jgi:hypothetical protein
MRWKFYNEKWLQTQLELATHLALIACFVVYENLV